MCISVGASEFLPEPRSSKAAKRFCLFSKKQLQNVPRISVNFRSSIPLENPFICVWLRAWHMHSRLLEECGLGSEEAMRSILRAEIGNWGVPASVNEFSPSIACIGQDSRKGILQLLEV